LPSPRLGTPPRGYSLHLVMPSTLSGNTSNLSCDIPRGMCEHADARARKSKTARPSPLLPAQWTTLKVHLLRQNARGIDSTTTSLSSRSRQNARRHGEADTPSVHQIHRIPTHMHAWFVKTSKNVVRLTAYLDPLCNARLDPMSEIGIPLKWRPRVGVDHSVVRPAPWWSGPNGT
jgi:hypothetical protein